MRARSLGVVGRRGIRRMPGARACWTVAVALVLMAALPAALLHDPGVTPKAITAVCALMFLARGFAAYAPAFRTRFPQQPFARYGRAVYAPLRLALGCAFAALIWNARS